MTVEPLHTSSAELLSHLLSPMLRRAVALVEDGVATAADVDLAMRLGARHPVGPLEYLRGRGEWTPSRKGEPDVKVRPGAWSEAPVGIVGSGFMACGIAHATAVAGQDVVLVARSPQSADRAAERIATDLRRACERGRLTEMQVEAARNRVRTAADVAALADSHLVVEAVVEDLAVKQDVFARLDAVLSNAQLLATNTSSLLVGNVARRTARRDRVAGIHFFSPVPAMKLVEVVGTPEVPEALLVRAHAWARSLGKVPVSCADRPGFIANSLLIPFLNDAVRAHEEGRGSIAEIDAVVKEQAGHPMGPFELLDFIGLDVALAAERAMFDAGGDERLRPARLLVDLVAAGRLGRKSGRGFHDYGRSRT